MTNQTDIPSKDIAEFAESFFKAAWQHAEESGECIFCGGDGICYDCRGWGSSQRENCGPCESCDDTESCGACQGTGIYPPPESEEEEEIERVPAKK